MSRRFVTIQGISQNNQGSSSSLLSNLQLNRLDALQISAIETVVGKKLKRILKNLDQTSNNTDSALNASSQNSTDITNLQNQVAALSTQVNNLAQNVARLPPTLLITGMMNNAFSQNGNLQPGLDYMEFTSNTTPTDSVPSLVVPYKMKLVRLTVNWCGKDPIVMNNAAEQWTINIQSIPPGLASNVNNMTPLNPNVFIYTLNPGDLVPANGYISAVIEQFTAEVILEKGMRFCVIGQETGSIQPIDGEVQLSLEFIPVPI